MIVFPLRLKNHPDLSENQRLYLESFPTNHLGTAEIIKYVCIIAVCLGTAIKIGMCLIQGQEIPDQVLRFTEYYAYASIIRDLLIIVLKSLANLFDDDTKPNSSESRKLLDRDVERERYRSVPFLLTFLLFLCDLSLFAGLALSGEHNLIAMTWSTLELITSAMMYSERRQLIEAIKAQIEP